MEDGDGWHLSLLPTPATTFICLLSLIIVFCMMIPLASIGLVICPGDE